MGSIRYEGKDGSVVFMKCSDNAGTEEDPVMSEHVDSALVDAIGKLDSSTASGYSLQDESGAVIPWNLNQLLRGILSNSVAIPNISQYGITIKPSKANIQDNSGIIINPGVSFLGTNGYSTYLFIQNLQMPSQPEGDLWINFGNFATIGAGSVRLAPGEKFKMEGSVIVDNNQSMYILGTVINMQYTIKYA